MRNVQIVSLLIAHCLLAAFSSARLSEAEPQLIERYGNPIMRTPDMMLEQGKILKLADRLHFRMDDWNIIAVMVGEHCENITYLKPGEWTEEQFRYILESNGGRSQWEEQKTTSPKTHREWKRRDKTMADWQMIGGMVLKTPAYEKAREDLRKHAKEEAFKLPKF